MPALGRKRPSASFTLFHMMKNPSPIKIYERIAIKSVLKKNESVLGNANIKPTVLISIALLMTTFTA